MKILFICNQGENRSRTAAELWKKLHPLHQIRYAGNNFDIGLLDWADKIIVFKKTQEDELKSIDYRYWGKSYNISIDDVYAYNSATLINILQKKLKLIDIFES
ncbi:MAG: hypothetical protein OEW69_07700 [Nitrospirota bacterium]|nr:hypothetical protein [Nitrospirota bacterium]